MESFEITSSSEMEQYLKRPESGLVVLPPNANVLLTDGRLTPDTVAQVYDVARSAQRSLHLR